MHNRRIHVLKDSKVIHRSDGSQCNTDTVTIAEKTITPNRVVLSQTEKGHVLR